MVNWRIYYGDGSTYDDEDGPIPDAPKRNVQAIAVVDEATGFLVLEGHDYYWYEDQWIGGDKFGLFDYLARPGKKVVFFGRSIPTERYQEIVDRARRADDLPAKSAKSPKER